MEDPAWGNGAFTKALVEALNGKAAYGGSKTITINMLDLYLSERVKETDQGAADTHHDKTADHPRLSRCPPDRPCLSQAYFGIDLCRCYLLRTPFWI